MVGNATIFILYEAFNLIDQLIEQTDKPD